MAQPQYFALFPDIKYAVKSNKAGKTTTINIKDYFHLLRVRDDIFKEDTLYYDHVIRDGQRPDQISFDEYGDEQWYWIILQINNITDYYNQWPLSNREFEQFLKQKYNTDENIGATHHWETVDTYDDDGRLMLPGGKVVSEDFKYEYPAEATSNVILTSLPRAVSNYEYEKRINDEKSHIQLIKEVHIPDYVRDVENYAKKLLAEGSNITLGDVIVRA
jgi:hypothetical protein